MDSDETTLQNALNILRQRHGAQLPGPQQRGVSEMRNTLTRDLGLDTALVHNILNNLTRTNRLEYVSDAKGDALPDAEGTGPVISMPLTQSADGGTPLITAAPLPFFAYPVLVLTFIGWIWSLLGERT